MSMPSGNSAASEFVYWQCQIRKFSVRNLEARPTPGICPDLVVNGKELGIITTLLVPLEPEDDISHLKHIYKKSLDPKIRREDAIKYLQSDFYQFPNGFNGELTALAAKSAKWIEQLINAEKVELLFEQDSRRWQLDCEIELLSPEDMRWQFTMAHNQLFNHTLTTNVEVVLFKPSWELSNE